MDPHELTLLEAAAALRTRQLGHLEYVQALLQQTERMAPLNAWISRDPEGLIEQAKSLDQARPKHQMPLAGISIAIKDNIDTSDLPTSGGTRSLLDARPQRNAPVVDVLLQAGALIAGKTNLHELALGGTTNNAVTGACRNPWNPLCIPGGSSGGSAVAVAARMVPAAFEQWRDTYLAAKPKRALAEMAPRDSDAQDGVGGGANGSSESISTPELHSTALPSVMTWVANLGSDRGRRGSKESSVAHLDA
jgi:hypothetical protein